LQDITHILFGEHLPFRQIYFIRGGWTPLFLLLSFHNCV
jgi:hypothetical protein